MEVGHTKFSPDAAFYRIRNCEKNFTQETIHDFRSMVFESTPMLNCNLGHIFVSDHFKKWIHHNRFKAMPNTHKTHIM